MFLKFSIGTEKTFDQIVDHPPNGRAIDRLNSERMKSFFSSRSFTSVAHSSMIPPTGMSMFSLELFNSFARSGMTPARCIACLFWFDRLRLHRASAPARATSMFFVFSAADAWWLAPWPAVGAFSSSATCMRVVVIGSFSDGRATDQSFDATV